MTTQPEIQTIAAPNGSLNGLLVEQNQPIKYKSTAFGYLALSSGLEVVQPARSAAGFYLKKPASPLT